MYILQRVNLCTLACLLLAGLAGRCLADNYAAQFTEATRNYAQGNYAAALPQWQRLLADFSKAPRADLALLRAAQCTIAASQWEPAAQSLTTLRAQYPASSYRAEATVLLYGADLALNKLSEADTLWQELFTRWPQSPFLLQTATLYLQAPRIAVAEAEKARMRQVLALEWPVLLKMLYPPLLQAGRVAEAQAAHEHCQALLQLAGAPDEQIAADEASYRESLSKDAMEAMFQLFKKALDAGDTPTALHWLTAMNNVTAAHPRSIEARKLYRQALAVKK